MAQVMLKQKKTDLDGSHNNTKPIDSPSSAAVGSSAITEYSIKCETDIVMTVSKGMRYGIIIQKGRQKIELTVDEWRSVVSNADSLEVGRMLLSGTLGVYTA